MVYDIPSQATIYRRLLELEEEVKKLKNEMEKVNKEKGEL